MAYGNTENHNWDVIGRAEWILKVQRGFSQLFIELRNGGEEGKAVGKYDSQQNVCK